MILEYASVNCISKQQSFFYYWWWKIGQNLLLINWFCQFLWTLHIKYILLLAKLQGEPDLLGQTKSMSVSSAEPHQVSCRQHSAIGHQAGAGKKGKNKICMVFDFHKYMYKTVEGCHRNFIPPIHYVNVHSCLWY